MRRALAGAILCAVLTATTARADSDLDRIPDAANAPTTPEAAIDPNRKIFLQNDLIGSTVRGDLAVPLPPPTSPQWEERLFLDIRRQWDLSDGLSFVFSDRLNLRAEDRLDFPSHEDIRNDLREVYLAWAVDGETFLLAGRINLKSGVALGYNPTDFFRSRAVVEALSADPAALREDRLGTFMLLAQRIWEGGAVTLAFAPKLADPTPIYTNTNLPTFNPVADRTNSRSRLLIKASANLADDFSPELLFYAEDGATRFGANLTRGFGQSVVGYVEWSGGDAASLAREALAYGRATGTIPNAMSAPIPLSADRHFSNDLSVGFSYTTESKIVFNLEYHLHEAGFSDADWRNWFHTGAAKTAPLDAELWYIRGYAADQQVPLARNGVFVRANWQDAFVRDLELTGFVNADMRDGSGLAQATADYYLSRSWTLGVLASGTFGARRSDFGSLPGEATLLFKVSRYL